MPIVETFTDRRKGFILYSSAVVSVNESDSFTLDITIPEDFKRAYLRTAIFQFVNIATEILVNFNNSASLNIHRSNQFLLRGMPSFNYAHVGWREFVIGSTAFHSSNYSWLGAPHSGLISPIPLEPGDICNFHFPPIDSNGTPTVDAVLQEMTFTVLDY